MEKKEGVYAPKGVADRVMAEARKLVGGDERKVRQLFSRSSWQWFQQTWGFNQFFIEPGMDEPDDFNDKWAEGVIEELREIAEEGDAGWKSEKFAQEVIWEIARHPWFDMLYYGMCADLGGQELVDLVMKKVVERVPGAKAEMDGVRADFDVVGEAYEMIVGKAIWEWDREVLVFFLEYLFDERKRLAEEYLKEGRKHQKIYIMLLKRLASDTNELVEVAFGRNILSEENGWVYCEGKRLVSVDGLKGYCAGDFD